MNGFNTNEPSRMRVIYRLSSFNKHFSSPNLVLSTAWECIWQIGEELELVRFSECRKMKEKVNETKGLGKD